MAADIPKIEFTPPGGSLTTITFEFPPRDDDYARERLRVRGRSTTTGDGTVQYITNHIENERFHRFTHVTTGIKDSFKSFFVTHFSKGRSFTYFQDKDEAATGVFTISPQQGRIFQATPMGSKWRFDMRFRKVE